MIVEERFIPVRRTARYHVLGEPHAAAEVWIVIHGYGQLARYFLSRFAGLEKGRYIVAPEGLGRFYLDEQHTRVGATWMTREDRLHEIEDHVAYLDTLCASLRSEVPPTARFHALGFSQGVATLARWAALGNTALDRMVFWGGQLPPDLDGDRARDRLSKSKILLVHGEQDTLVPLEVLERNQRALLALGSESTAWTWHGGHAIDATVLHRAWEMRW